MSKDEYLITDAPLKALTVFAMPMILGSFFQQVYNMADSIIVGQFVGSYPGFPNGGKHGGKNVVHEQKREAHKIDPQIQHRVLQNIGAIPPQSFVTTPKSFVTTSQSLVTTFPQAPDNLIVLLSISFVLFL